MKNFVKKLSQYCLTESETEVLNKGLNFAIRKKTDQLYKKIEKDKLFYALKYKERKSELSLEDKLDLLIKLKNFAINDPRDFSGDNLTHKKHQAL